MNAEFKRFGLSEAQRKLTGMFQLLGSLGLLTGFITLWVGLFSALGLTIMMLVAFLIRFKMKDSLVKTTPSFVFLLLNAWITYAIYSSIS